MGTLKDSLNKSKENLKSFDNKEIEEKLKKLNMMEDKPTEIKSSQITKTVKINVVLPENEHLKFKMHCGIQKTNMQEKAKEIIQEWLEEQPNLIL